MKYEGRGCAPGRRSTRRPGTARAPAARPPPAPARARRLRRSPWRRPRKRRGGLGPADRVVAQSERGGGWCRAGSGAAAPDPNAAWRSSESGRRTRDGENREGRCGEGFRRRVGAGVGPVVSGRVWFGLVGAWHADSAYPTASSLVSQRWGPRRYCLRFGFPSRFVSRNGGLSRGERRR